MVVPTGRRSPETHQRPCRGGVDLSGAVPAEGGAPVCRRPRPGAGGASSGPARGPLHALASTYDPSPWPTSAPSAPWATPRPRVPSATWSRRPTTSSRRRSAACYLAASPYNAVRLILPEVSYEEVGGLIASWRQDGVLGAAPEPVLVAWTQTFALDDGVERERRTILGAVGLEPYERRVVRPHERTHAGPKEDRLRLTRAVRTNLSPVFGLYPDPGQAAWAAIAPQGPPDAELADHDGTVHRVWRVTDPAAARPGGRGHGGPLDPDRRRPPPLRDGPGLPRGAPRPRGGQRRRPGRCALRPRADGPDGARRPRARRAADPPRARPAGPRGPRRRSRRTPVDGLDALLRRARRRARGRERPRPRAARRRCAS